MAEKKNNKIFIESSKLMQKKILTIESNQLFLKFKAQDIITLAIEAKNTTNHNYQVFNDIHLKIQILRAVPLNLGYLLGKLQFLNISAMGIYKLFDEKKFFEIVFDEKIDNDDISFIEQVIKESFDMTKIIKLKKPKISKSDLFINCEHTDELAQMKIETKDQKGLFSYIAKAFDDFDIEIHSAKIQSNRGKANDMLLISKNGNFCKNKEEIVEILTN